MLGIYENASKRLNVMKSFKFHLDRSTLRCLYTSLIRPQMEYADIVWDNCTSGNSNLLESVQYDAAKIITGAIKGTSARKLREELAWVKLKTRRKIHKIIFFYKSLNRMTPAYICNLVPLRVLGERSNIRLRSATEFSTSQCRTEMFKTSFSPSVINLWNNLSLDIRQLDSLSVFKHTLNNLLHPLKYNRFFDSSLSRRLDELLYVYFTC